MLKRQNLPDFYLEDALPFLQASVEKSYDEYPSVVEKIFNVSDMKNGIAQHSQVSALSAASEVGEGEEIPQDRVYQGYSKTFKSRKFGVLLATSQESIDDERFDSISKNAYKLGVSMRSAVEVDGASVFNNGFSTNGNDGVPLFSASHPLLAPGAGLSSNIMSTPADLSATSLKDMITVFKKQKDTAGNKIMIKPRYLLVPSELEYLAFELVRTTYSPNDANNNLSSIGPQGLYRLDPVCWEFLTDNDATFLLGEKSDHEIRHYWSKHPEIKQSIDFKSDVALTRMLSRWDVGYADWRGVVGNAGA